MKNLTSLVNNIEFEQPDRLQTILERPNNKSIKSALIESFEKKEIGLTTDYVARVMKNHIEKILSKMEECNNLELTWFDKALKEWMSLILQIRGDISKEKEGNKVLLAQQFIAENQKKTQEFDKIVTYYLTKFNSGEIAFKVEDFLSSK